MSRDKSKNRNQRMNDNRNKFKKEIKIPSDVKKLASLNFKKFKKDNKGYYDGKKEYVRAYYNEIIDYLPTTIAFLVKFGQSNDEIVKETKDNIFEKIADPDFGQFLRKELKDGLEFNNLALLPMILNEIIVTAAKADAAAKAEDPNTGVHFDVSDLIKINKRLLKKPLKKMTEKGIDENLALDVLTTIPSIKIIGNSQYFHLRNLFNVLYEHAKTQDIDFNKLIDVVIGDEFDEYGSIVITFALLERKEKISGFNDSQKKLFNDITNWVFNSLEKMKKDSIRDVFMMYCNIRKSDEAAGHDANRRYYISSLPEADYPKIIKVVTSMIEENNDLSKYF